MFTFWEGRVHFGTLPRAQIDMQFQDTSVLIEPHHIFSGAHSYYWRFNCTVGDRYFIYTAYHDGFEHSVILRPSSPDRLYRRTRSPRRSNYTEHTLKCDLVWSLEVCLQGNHSDPLIAMESDTEDVYRDIELSPSCIATKYPARKSPSVTHFESLFIFHRQLPKVAIPHVDIESASA